MATRLSEIAPARTAEILKARRWSVLELGRRAGLPRGRIEHMLRGHEPKLATLEAIATAAGVTVNWLMGKEDDADHAEQIAVYPTGGGPSWVVSEDAAPYHVTFPRGLRGFEVYGDSMEPVARHGQVVLALPNVQPKDEDLAVVEYEKDGVRVHAFKRVYFQDHTVTLASVNQAYRPETIKCTAVKSAMKVWGVKF